MSTDMTEATSDLRTHFENIADWADRNPDHSEPELISYITQTDLLENLGYEELGRDYRVDKSTGGSAKRPDIRAIDRNTGEVVFVIETKRSGRSEALRDHRGQLENRYMFRLRADYGLLLNGDSLIFYERTGRRQATERFPLSLDSPNDDDLRTLVECLSRKVRTYNTLTSVSDFFDKYEVPEERLPLARQESRTNFYDDFALRNKSSFRDLVQSVAGLFEEMRGTNEFTESAYDFWLRSYAREIDIEDDDEDAPEWWEDIIEKTPLSWSNTGIQRFMFCLETSYALFSRLILAKASADAEMPGIEFASAFRNELEDIERSDDLPDSGWPIITKRVSERMRRQLIEGVFEEDIFYWWTDDLDIYSDDIDRVWSESGQAGETNDRLEPFGESLRNIILSLHKYDFGGLIDEPGDPLGDLYQNYFDKKTRKALGEFYTPQVTVDYMLDRVGYGGAGVQDSRFIDPACGSGTFIVTALRRYLDNNSERAEREGWQRIIEELCSEFKIVGLDIHPFAVLMSQVQFMLVLIPAYKRALQETGEFHAQRLPIFRTNSLEIIGQTSAEGWEDDTIPVQTRLPVKNEEGDEIELTLDFPRHKSVIGEDPGLGIYNPEGYFVALQAVFAAVKEQATLAQEGHGDYEVPVDVLKEEMEEHFQALPGDRNPGRLATFFKKKIADTLIGKIETLVTQHDDGRLVKSIEDNAMATLLKDTDHVTFDFVVANPPYVDNQGKEEVANQTENLDAYSTTDGNWDLYYPFMEKGIKWLSDDGRFAYITPDQYMRGKWADDVRDVITSRTQIEEIVDFRDTPVFEGVLNYPCITVLENNEDVSDDHDLDFVRVTSAPSNDDPENEEEESLASGERVGIELLDIIRENIGSDFRDEYIETYSYPQANLGRDIWSIMPEDEQEVFDLMMERRTHRIRELAAERGNFEGIRTGLNTVFVVQPVHRQLVLGDEEGTVTVRPSGSDDDPKWSDEYEVDAALLRPYLRGKEVGRWTLKSWSGQHVVLPYTVNEGTFGDAQANLIPEDRLEDEDEFRATYEYLNTFREELEGRDSLGESDAWYAYSRNQAIAKFGQPKVMNTEVSGYPQFMVDEDGQWYAASAYGMRLVRDHQERTGYVTALLNSDVVDFVLKHLSVLKDGNHYKYVTEYVKRLPLILPEEEDEQTPIEGLVDEVDERTRLASKVDGFPGAYRDEDTPVDPKSVTCDSSHRDIDPDISQSDETTYHVVIGVRKKEDPIVVNSEAKARYLAASLRGRTVEQDETLTVTVPQSSEVAERMLTEWESDKDELGQKRSIAEIQQEIDGLVFDLFFEEGEDHHREVIDRFHDRYSSRPS